MFMLLDLARRVHFYWLHYQVQTIRTSKILRVNSESVLLTFFDMNIPVLCTHLHDIAKACGIDDASIVKNALVDSIFISTHYAYIWFLLFAFIHAFEVMQLSCVHLALLLACLSAFLSVFLLVCFATTFREQFLDLKAGVFLSLQSMLVYIVVGRLQSHIGNKHLAYYCFHH